MSDIKTAILTISDKGFEGKREDVSGKIIREIITTLQGKVVRYDIVPDEKKIIKERLVEFSDELRVDLVLTTGGTGFGPRDVTPEATKEIVEREVPGFGELMRIEGAKKTSMAILSRSTAGIRGGTLIINLPGSPTAVRESLEIILPVIPHSIKMLRGGGH